MGQLFKNNAESTLAVAIASTDVVPMNVQVAAGHGDRFPLIATIGADYFDITLESADGLVEIFRIKQRTAGSDVLVVDSRARESTTAKSWATSPAIVVGLRLTAAAIETVLAHPAATPGAHAATAISNTPAGNIAATTVQAAINELDSEKEAVGTASSSMTSHTNAADPHTQYATNTELTNGLAGKQAADPQLDTLSAITAQQATDLSSLSAFMGTMLNDTDAATARATLNIVGTPVYDVATAQTYTPPPASTDLNLCVQAGAYNFIDTATNKPAGITSWGFLLVFRHNNVTSGAVYVHQTAYDMNGSNVGAMYTRRGLAGEGYTAVWSPWVRSSIDAEGSAPVYAARAWVNFNGTGVVAIRAAGNVSSITDNGVGDYTVNFTTAMPDADFSVVLDGTGNVNVNHTVGFIVSTLAGSARIKFHQTGNSANTADQDIASVAIFR